MCGLVGFLEPGDLMFKLLKSARKAFKLWRKLPAEERAQHAAKVQRVMSLVRELGGSRAASFVEDSVDCQEEVDTDDLVAPPTGRVRAEVVAELQEATSALLQALGPTAGDLARDSVPLSLRLSGKLVAKGAQRYLRASSQEAPRP
jgi:hypothetical protein